MRPRHYILDDERRPVPVDMMTWAQWFEDADRHVAETFTELYRVSTVFLGLDHNFREDGPAILFETMAFEREPHLMKMFGSLREIHAEHEGECHRYATWDDADAGHNATVRRILREEAKATETIRNAKQFVGDIDAVATALGEKGDR